MPWHREPELRDFSLLEVNSQWCIRVINIGGAKICGSQQSKGEGAGGRFRGSIIKA